jgi:hypothetical protein
MSTSAPKISFEELCKVMGIYQRHSMNNLRNPKEFEVGRQVVKEWFAQRGIELELSDG